VAANPGALNLDEEVRRFQYKVEAGAEFAITQPVFDVQEFSAFLGRIDGSRIPILGGITPLESLRHAEFMANEVPGVRVPEAIEFDTRENLEAFLARHGSLAVKPARGEQGRGGGVGGRGGGGHARTLIQGGASRLIGLDRDPAAVAAARSALSEFGDRVEVRMSMVEESTVEDDVDMGPYSHLRPGSYVCQGVHIGNFAEVKGARLGRRTKMGHHSYIGDANVGDDVNIGAGTITANFDGEKKHRTVIGDGAFIGTDTMLVAPVRVGAGARTSAGAVVNRDVPDGMMAIGAPARLRALKPEEEESNTGQ